MDDGKWHQLTVSTISASGGMQLLVDSLVVATTSATKDLQPLLLGDMFVCARSDTAQVRHCG